MEAKSADELLERARDTNVLIYCGSDLDESVVLAQCCSEEGVHFVGKLEHSASVLLRMKTLHYAAKKRNCAIIPVCSRDTTLAELGLLALKTTFMPGVLLEASLFQPIARNYKSLFWDTAKLALQRVDSSYASSTSLQNNATGSKTPKGSSSPRVGPIVKNGNSSTSELKVPPIDISLSTDSSSASSTIDSDRLHSISSLDNLAEGNFLLQPGNSTKLKSKAKSYGDLSHAEVSPNAVHSIEGSGTHRHTRRSSSGVYSRKKISRRSLPPVQKPPLIPSFKQVIRSRSTASLLAEPTSSSLHPVVAATLETVPVRLCPAQRSVTPLALSSTTLIASEGNESAHKLEVHHLLTTSMRSRFFFFLFRLLLLLFIVVPLFKVLLTSLAPRKLGVKRDSSANEAEETKARLGFYIDRAPTTLPLATLRKIDPKFDRQSLRSFSRDFTEQNARPLVIGAIGTTSSYLASSSHQTSSQLKFVETSAPYDIGPLHANVMCVSMCAIALAIFPEQVASVGVVPPLSAGGRRLKDWLLEEGFQARLISYGRK